MSEGTYKAYAIGYYNARALGEYYDIYDGGSELSYFYRLGYDAGISDYSQFDIDEEI